MFRPSLSLKLAAVLATVLATGCKTPLPRTLDDAYEVTLAARTSVGFNAHGEQTTERLEAGRAVVRELWEAGEVRSPEEHVRVAFVLVSSRDLGDLDLAHKIAWEAGELGDQRGWPLAAEALDRALFLQGDNQRFGTQFVYEPVLARWILYPIDPATSDAERQRFGIPPLSALRAYEARLNQSPEEN
jgi:hypothetical protein